MTTKTTRRPAPTTAEEIQAVAAKSSATMYYTVEQIAEKLATNWKWASAGMKRIYAEQTRDEQVDRSTKWHNGVGFSAAHAHKMSRLTEALERGRGLSKAEWDYVFRVMPQYAAQLHRLTFPGMYQ